MLLAIRHQSCDPEPSTHLMKSLPISFRHGISVPQYGESDKMEATRGIMNRASRLKMSKDWSMSA